MNIAPAAEAQRSLSLDVLKSASQNSEPFLDLIKEDTGKQLLSLAQATEQINIAQQAIATGQSFDVRI